MSDAASYCHSATIPRPLSAEFPQLLQRIFTQSTVGVLPVHNQGTIQA